MVGMFGVTRPLTVTQLVTPGCAPTVTSHSLLTCHSCSSQLSVAGKPLVELEGSGTKLLSWSSKGYLAEPLTQASPLR